MSFAPSKDIRKKSPEKFKEKSLMEMPHSTYSIAKSTYQEIDPASRTENLESNLDRITKQQEDLMPLMNMLEMAPNVARSDQLLKNLHKKNQETDERLLRMEQLIKNYNSGIEASIQKISALYRAPQFDPVAYERNLKNAANQLRDMQAGLNKLENQFMEYQKRMMNKLNSEADRSSKIIDGKFEKHRADFTYVINDVKKNVNDTLMKYDENLKLLFTRADNFDKFQVEWNKDVIFREIRNDIQKRFENEFEVFREKYDSSIESLNRDYGVARSEMDLINEEKRQIRIGPKLNQVYQDAPAAEKNIKLNNIYEDSYLYELEKFNEENTQRIMYELQSFDEQLDNFKNKYLDFKGKNKQQKFDEETYNRFNSELDTVDQRYTTLKYQIEGAFRKKKFLFDLSRIKDKMEKINQIKTKGEEDMITDSRLRKTLPPEFNISAAFPERINELMTTIQNNLETSITRLELVEDKIHENQELVKRKDKK